MWRLEVKSPRGERERAFLHFMTALPASAPPTNVKRLRGEGLRGGTAHVEGRAIAVVFAEPRGEGEVALGGPADVLVVAGLEPGRRYAANIDAGGCKLRLRAGGEQSPTATSGGFLRLGPVCGGAK